MCNNCTVDYSTATPKQYGGWIVVGDEAYYTGSTRPGKPTGGKPTGGIFGDQPQAELDDGKHFVDEDVHLVNIGLVNNITYFISDDVLARDDSEDWVAAITIAADEWSNIENCAVNFSRTFNRNAATFLIRTESTFPQPISDQSLAVAALPFQGNIRRLGIGIQDDVTFTARGMIGVMRHEFGHIIGIRHTDHDFEESNQDRDPDHRYMRCTDDNPSVMYATGSSTSERFMGDGDRAAARFMYPISITPATLSTSSWVVDEEYGYQSWNLEWTFSQGTDLLTMTERFDVQERIEYDNGSVEIREFYDTRNTGACDDPSFSYLRFENQYGDNNCYSWRIRARNRGGDVVTAWSPWTNNECLSD